MKRESIVVAAAQVCSIPGAKSGNLQTIRRLCAAAESRGVELVVFPELFLTGYSSGEKFGALSERADGPSFEAISGIAAKSNIAICYGYAEREGCRIFNSTQLIGPDGLSLGNHRKTHLYGDYERKWFDAGEALSEPARLHGIAVNMLVCYEIEFPEIMRSISRQGVSIVLVPTATGTSNNPDQVAQTLVRARAAENHAFVVYANHAAGEGSLDLNGNSVVAGPFGKILGRSDSDDEELVYCTLELNVSEESRRVNPYQNDLRIDIL